MHMDEISAGLSLPMTQLLKCMIVLQKKDMSSRSAEISL